MYLNVCITKIIYITTNQLFMFENVLLILYSCTNVILFHNNIQSEILNVLKHKISWSIKTNIKPI